MARLTPPPFRAGRGGPTQGMHPHNSPPAPPVRTPPARLVPNPVTRSTPHPSEHGGASEPHLLTPEAIKSVQKFLAGHGYKIAVDGIAGPQTKAAIRDFFRPGQNSGLGNVMETILGTTHLKGGARNAHAFNNQFGNGHSVVMRQPNSNGIAPDPKPAPVPNPDAGTPLPNPIQSLISSLIKQAQGGIGTRIPMSLATDFAAPYTAAAQADQTQIDNMPNAKLQALADIANWYGQVGKSLSTAKTRDSDATTAGTKALGDATAAIVSSLGGSAMPGAGVVGAVGQNGANELTAEGAANSQLYDDLAPIFTLAEAGAKKSTGAAFDQQLQAAKDQLAKDQGSATAATATAKEDIFGKNNAYDQTQFGDLSSILNVLAGLQTAGYKAQSNALLNALRLKKLQTNPNTFAAASPKSKAAVAQQISQTIAQMGQKDPAQALATARNIVKTNGWAALNPDVVNQVIIPALNIAGVHFVGNPQMPFQP